MFGDAEDNPYEKILLALAGSIIVLIFRLWHY